MNHVKTTEATAGKGTRYVDTTAEAGVTYQYRVRGRNGKVYGAYKAGGNVTAKAA